MQTGRLQQEESYIGFFSINNNYQVKAKLPVFRR
jgi:hypothetical protein